MRIPPYWRVKWEGVFRGVSWGVRRDAVKYGATVSGDPYL
jgi:hypothetical protein